MSIADALEARPVAAPARLFARDTRWLFGKRADTLAFGGSAIAGLALIAIGAPLGWLDREVSPVAWLVLVVGLDVAHVWSTLFRVYFDREELARRRALYIGVPIACYAVGVALAATSMALFWTVVAYAAVFHFVRQQAGWIALLHRRRPEEAIDRVLDMAAIYASTIYPIVYWHAHLPRRFAWMIAGDFVVGLPPIVERVLAPVYWLVIAAFAVRQIWLALARDTVRPAKMLIVTTTWLSWWLGIVALDSDFAFTATNVIVHAVPYLVLTYRYARARPARSQPDLAMRLSTSALTFVGVLLVLALLEETAWDTLVFHDRPFWFGDGVDLGVLALALVVPLLALPQLVHYVLDGVIWRRGAMSNSPLSGTRAT